jgi:serine protease
MTRMRLLAAGVAALAVAACSDDMNQPTNEAGIAPALALAPLQTDPDQVVAGEVIVKTRAGADARLVAKAHGVAFKYLGYGGKFAVLRGAAGREYANAAALQADPRVEYAEPNYLRHINCTVTPNLWAFYNPGGLNMSFTSDCTTIPTTYQSVLDADEDAAVSAVSPGSYTPATYAAIGTNVTIGSIDTGVDSDHPEFASDCATGTGSRLIKGQDWINLDADPEDDNGHGTHTTGTMAGCTVGVAGVSGAAPHVTVFVQKVCTAAGSCPTSAIVNAIYAATTEGVIAMNLSLVGNRESRAEKAAIADATDHNALVIASAGNAGSGKLSCPACDVNAISVAATSWQDLLTYYSSYGRGLDISAPGGQCYSNTTPEGCIYSSYLAGGYAWLQGTSMAAPQVTGTAAIVASTNAALRGATLRARLLNTTDDLGKAGYDIKFGWGRVNSYRAVTNSSLAESAASPLVASTY